MRLIREALDENMGRLLRTFPTLELIVTHHCWLVEEILKRMENGFGRIWVWWGKVAVFWVKWH